MIRWVVLLIVMLPVVSVGAKEYTCQDDDGKLYQQYMPCPDGYAPEDRRQQEWEAMERERKRVKEEHEAEDPCRRKIGCWGDKHLMAATHRCQPMVERSARYDYEWTDGMFGVKFGSYRWKDQRNGVVTYSGNSIKMQNGYGAWQAHRYACDFDTVNEQVVDVRVRPGR